MEMDSTSSEFDIWRDSPLRLCGYANEVGEAFRPIFPKYVMPSYGVAFGYCAGDTIDKASIMYRNSNLKDKHRNHVIALCCFDTLLWQSLASVFIPGFTINQVVKATQFGMNRLSIAQVGAKRFVPTAVGLSVIPAIIKPIDNFVDYMLNNGVRPYYPDYYKVL
uniref:Mitochondrial fission process protein 1 n=1 Tax=Aplanochytrium stocchinoi TaxID=215587 RepID=A0A7S3V0W7_9STRA